MTAIECIKSAQCSELVDVDGDPVSIELLPPLTTAQIEELQAELEMTLPQDLRDLLAFCSGIEGAAVEIDFTGASMSFAYEDAFPFGLPFAADGFGNFWVLDITPQTSDAAPVFFACHDAPVILFQSADLAGFLSEVFHMSTPPHHSLVDDVHEDRLYDVWRKNPGVIDQASAASSEDPVLKSFAETLTPQFQIIDLRGVKPGMGFSWGRYGATTEVRRHGYERVFAYAKPAQKSLLAKFFGR